MDCKLVHTEVENCLLAQGVHVAVLCLFSVLDMMVSCLFLAPCAVCLSCSYGWDPPLVLCRWCCVLLFSVVLVMWCFFCVALAHALQPPLFCGCWCCGSVLMEVCIFSLPGLAFVRSLVDAVGRLAGLFLARLPSALGWLDGWSPKSAPN